MGAKKGPKTKGRASGTRRNGRSKFNRHTDQGYVTKAGPCTITKADGTVTVVDALTPREYRAKMKVRPTISPQKRARIFKRDGGVCRYCDANAEVIDHVVPIAQGGTNRYSNLVSACTACNTKKGATVWTPKRLRAQAKAST